MIKTMSNDPEADTDLLHRWVETWRRAGAELERIRCTELESVDTREAVRQIFEGLDHEILKPGPPTSGLVEQQAWFARLRQASRSR